MYLEFRPFPAVSLPILKLHGAKMAYRSKPYGAVAI